MKQRLSIHEDAEAEINEASAFYDMRSPGLGAEFLQAVEYAVALIGRYPKGSPLGTHRVGSRPIPRFPYSVIYSVREKEIRILAVAHHKRRPWYWRSRR